MADALEEERVGHGLSRTVKDLFAGAVGGVAQVLIGEQTASRSLPVLLRVETYQTNLS